MKKLFAKYTNTQLINLTQPKKHGQMIIFYWYLHNVAWWKVITLNSSHVNNTLLIPSSGPICNQHQIFVFVFYVTLNPFFGVLFCSVWAYQSCSSLFLEKLAPHPPVIRPNYWFHTIQHAQKTHMSSKIDFKSCIPFGTLRKHRC